MRLGQVLFAAIAVLLVVVMFTSTSFRDREGLAVHVSGDLGMEIREVLLNADPDLYVEINPRDATATVLTVTDWSKMSHIPDAAALCGTTCAPDSDTRLVRILQPEPFTGSRKHLIVHIGDLLDDDAIAGLGRDAPEVRCIARLIARDLSALYPFDEPTDPCLPESLKGGREADKVIAPWAEPH